MCVTQQTIRQRCSVYKGGDVPYRGRQSSSSYPAPTHVRPSSWNNQSIFRFILWLILSTLFYTLFPSHTVTGILSLSICVFNDCLMSHFLAGGRNDDALQFFVVGDGSSSPNWNCHLHSRRRRANKFRLQVPPDNLCMTKIAFSYKIQSSVEIGGSCLLLPAEEPPLKGQERWRRLNKWWGNSFVPFRRWWPFKFASISYGSLSLSLYSANQDDSGELSVRFPQQQVMDVDAQPILMWVDRVSRTIVVTWL